MPRARHDLALDPAFGERSALVRARIFDRVKDAVDIEDRDLTIADDVCARLAAWDIGDLRHGNELRHGGPFAGAKREFMLSDFRAFLESELKLLGNASHHAYSFGQANMAKRALERLDAEVAEHVPLLLPIADAQAALAALEAEAAPDSTLDPALARVRDLLRAALVAPA
jgi:hypothetical protein